MSEKQLSTIFIDKQLQKARKILHPYMPMEDAQWQKFKSSLIIRKYAKNEFILNEGETEKYLSIVVSGVTRHYVPSKGEEKSFDFSFQHEFNCSYASFIQQSSSKFYIQALEPTILASLHYNVLQELYKLNPLSNIFGRTAVEQYYIWREEREISLLTDSAEERYIKLMEKYPIYIQKIPQKYLSSYLNIKPESLSRIKKKIAGG